MELKFIVDDYVMIGKKRFALNLNIYRNTYYRALNDAKKNFKHVLYNQYPLLNTIRANKVKISYKVIPHNNRKFDLMNVISIVDKFFLDALVESGCILDDNYNYVTYGEIIAGDIQKDLCKKIEIFCNFL